MQIRRSKAYILTFHVVGATIRRQRPKGAIQAKHLNIPSGQRGDNYENMTRQKGCDSKE